MLLLPISRGDRQTVQEHPDFTARRSANRYIIVFISLLVAATGASFAAHLPLAAPGAAVPLLALIRRQLKQKERIEDRIARRTDYCSPPHAGAAGQQEAGSRILEQIYPTVDEGHDNTSSLPQKVANRFRRKHGENDEAK